MSILDKIKKILPKRKEPDLKGNVLKEKENIRKTFAAYCNSNHDTSDGKLCPKCTALLTSVMLKIQRCPYGLSKPICDKCDTPCFGEETTNNFLKVMHAGQKKMRFSHPIMAIRHKIASLGMDYAKMERDKNATDKQKEREEKAKSKIANATRSPKNSAKSSKAKAKKKKKK